jgi:SAM-dependent methyltransferase
MLILNLGCGSNKIEGAVNVDIETSCKPDLIHNFTHVPLPYGEGSVDRVYLFHVIEHIPKKLHRFVLSEISRVLKPGGEFYVSYPEFIECAKRYIENTEAKRDFWEATLYGRQLYESDFHVALMFTPHFLESLREFGFSRVIAHPEPEEYNTVVFAVRANGKVQTIEENYNATWRLPDAQKVIAPVDTSTL